MSSINEVLAQLISDVDGAMVALLGDSDSGMLLASAGTGLDVEIAAAGATETMRAKLNTMRALKLDAELEDILVTLSTQYHIIRPSARVRSRVREIDEARARSVRLHG